MDRQVGPDAPGSSLEMRFLDFGTSHILASGSLLGRLFLCTVGCSVACLASTQGSSASLDVSSAPLCLQLWQPKLSSDSVKCLLGTKLPPLANHFFKVWDSHKSGISGFLISLGAKEGKPTKIGGSSRSLPCIIPYIESSPEARREGYHPYFTV